MTNSAPGSPVSLPDRIGPYRVIGSLGAGGMGVVFRAVHDVTGAIVALKTVQAQGEAVLAGIRREVHALRALEHPGVVQIVDEGLASGIPWYAMEVLDGPTLRRFHRERSSASSDPSPDAEDSDRMPTRSTPSRWVAPASSRRGAGASVRQRHVERDHHAGRAHAREVVAVGRGAATGGDHRGVVGGDQLGQGRSLARAEGRLVGGHQRRHRLTGARRDDVVEIDEAAAERGRQPPPDRGLAGGGEADQEHRDVGHGGRASARARLTADSAARPCW